MGFVSIWDDIPRPVRTSLDTIPTTDAVLLVHQDNTILSLIGSANRTNGDTRGIVTLIAQLRHKKTLSYVKTIIFCAYRFFGKPVSTRIRRIDKNLVILGNDIP